MTNQDQNAAEKKKVSPISYKFIHTFSVGVLFDVIFSLHSPLKLPAYQLEHTISGMSYMKHLKYSYMDAFSVFGALYDITTGGLLLAPRDCHMIAAETTRIGYAKLITSYNRVYYSSHDDFAFFIENKMGVAMLAIGLAGEIICSYNEYENQTA